MIEGVHVVRVLSFITANEGFVLRIFNCIIFTTTGALASLFEYKVDVVLRASPRFYYMYSLGCGKIEAAYLSFDLHDIRRESIKAVGKIKDFFVTLLSKRFEFFYR